MESEREALRERKAEWYRRMKCDPEWVERRRLAAAEYRMLYGSSVPRGKRMLIIGNGD